MFTVPNHIAPGGTSGLGTALAVFIPLSIGVLTWLVNLPILLTAWKVFGTAVMVKTLIAASVLSFFIDGLTPFLPTFTDNLSGTVSGEYDQMVMDMQPDEIIELVKRRFPALTDDQVEAFIQNDADRDEKTALMDMFNDIGLRGRHIVATESVIEGGAEGYVYYITSKPKDGKLRTQHCYEIPMVTGKQDSGIYLDLRSGEKLHGEEPDYELGKKVQRCWANFIMNGDPNNELLGIKWPEYTLDEKQTMVIDSEWQVVNEVRPKDMAIARKFQ